MADYVRKAGIARLRIEDVGEGAMGVTEPFYVLSAAFFARCSSRGEGASVDKLTSAMWPGSGGLGEIPR
jgi:hypothetical protein